MSSAIKAGAAFVELGIRNKMERGLNAASRRLKGFASGISGAGMSMAGLGLKIAAPFTLAAGIFGSFDAKMAAVKAITGSTEAQMARLRDTAKTLGSSTQFSASQAAEAMKFLGMAGFDTEEILAGIPAVLDLAAAGGLELGMAADIASDVSSAFGLAADEIGRVADVMAATATSSNTSVEMMGETFKYLAPLAAAAGQSIEQAAAAVGIVANSGVKASMAGTDLALMMKTLANPAAQKQLSKMGVETIDAAGNVRDFSDIIRDLNVATAGMTEAKKLAFFEGMFGRAAKSALILTGATADLDTLGNKLENAGGSAARMAATMQDSLMGDFTKMLSALEGVAIAVGEAIAGPIRAFLSQVADALSMATQWISQNQGLVTSIAAVGAVLILAGAALVAIAAPIAIVGVMLSGIATFAGMLAGMIGFLGTAIAAIVSPIGLTLAAVTALGAAILYYSGAGAKAVGGLRGVWSSLAGEVSKVSAGIMAALTAGDLSTIGKILSQSLAIYWKEAVNGMRKVWIGFRVWFVNSFNDAVNAVVNGLLSALGKALEKLGSITPGSIGDAIAEDGRELNDLANRREREGRDGSQRRFDEGADEIAKLDAEIAALRAARDATIEAATQAAAEAAGEAATGATEKAREAAQAAAAGAGEMLRGSGIEAGTFSAFAAERSFRNGGGVTEAFRTVAKDIVAAVNGVTGAVEDLDGMAFDT